MSFSGARPMRPPSILNTLRRAAPRLAAFTLVTSKVRYKGIQPVQVPGQPPMRTVGQPRVIVPPCAVVSPIRAAGLPPISTVVEPRTMASGGPTHKHCPPTVAAGKPPISTVGAPGGNIGPPTWG